MRRWVILPLVFNIVLFASLYRLAGSALSGWIAAATAGGPWLLQLLDWLWRTLLVGGLILILWLIPVIWFLWSGGLLGLQYVDYGADTRQVPFLSMKAAAHRERLLALGFGCIVLAVTMVPLVNLVIMPVAVIAGVLIWQKALKVHIREQH
jgi:uncharacterized protein involved in cysteine biosynthesis